MALELAELHVDALDPERLAGFWSALLQRVADGPMIPDGGSGFDIRFVPTLQHKTAHNRVHFDLTSTSLEDLAAIVDRAIRLGGRHVDIGQGPDEHHVVLGDPEGNEFCVIEPGNRFLANTDLIGAVNCDGTRGLGLFWTAALDWPLVWDDNDETAIQSPRGGSKVTWSGPPLMPRSGRDRIRLAVACAPSELEAETRRLCSLGATTTGGLGDEVVALVDPDGNEFTLARRVD